RPVSACENAEASARGAAFLAGLATGVWNGLDEISTLLGPTTPFCQKQDPPQREAALLRWQDAVARSTLRPDALKM
ncbi:MAG: glycerol kinase, partial [Pseudomonadota bacterium]